MVLRVSGSSKRRPIKRLTEKTVFSGLTTAWRLAVMPTRRSPPLVKATTDGVVRAPSEFAITVGLPPSITATTLLVVPRSMPIILLIETVCLLNLHPFSRIYVPADKNSIYNFDSRNGPALLYLSLRAH